MRHKRGDLKKNKITKRAAFCLIYAPQLCVPTMIIHWHDDNDN